MKSVQNYYTSNHDTNDEDIFTAYLVLSDKVKFVNPVYYTLPKLVSDVGGFGSAIYLVGDTCSRVFSRYSFMKLVITMLFLVRKFNPVHP